MNDRMKRAALKYASELGYAVGPAHWIRDGRCTCSKGIDCGNPGKHPRWIKNVFEHGLLSATSDPDILTMLFDRWPNANIFRRPDQLSAVLDVDPRSGGDDSLAELESKHGKLPETVICLTGGRGVHYHFRTRQQIKGTQVAPGLELKGPDQLLILPPSMHISGNRYEWEVSGHPLHVEPAFLPEWLATLGERKEGRVNPPGWAAEWLRTPIGEKDGRRGPDGLPKFVGYLIDKHVDSDVAVEILRLWDLQNPVPLGEDAVREHVEGMYQRYFEEPATMTFPKRGVMKVA